MWDWLAENSWVAWTGGAVLLAIAELLSMDFVLLMLAGGALGGAVTAALGAESPVQIVVAVAVALASLLFVRPSVVRRLHSGPELTTGHAALVGRQAVVLEEVTAVAGLVKLAGEVWTARPFDDSMIIPVGVSVDVFEIDGATAVVYPVDGGAALS
ncbi:MAG TPA: NfeD family protein [Nocardioidaceae bacterium]|nr:NfeD family protein [Nocardioidaceae bacterium]